jgi:hypothetical protein
MIGIVLGLVRAQVRDPAPSARWQQLNQPGEVSEERVLFADRRRLLQADRDIGSADERDVGRPNCLDALRVCMRRQSRSDTLLHSVRQAADRAGWAVTP